MISDRLLIDTTRFVVICERTYSRSFIAFSGITVIKSFARSRLAVLNSEISLCSQIALELQTAMVYVQSVQPQHLLVD